MFGFSTIINGNPGIFFHNLRCRHEIVDTWHRFCLLGWTDGRCIHFIFRMHGLPKWRTTFTGSIEFWHCCHDFGSNLCLHIWCSFQSGGYGCCTDLRKNIHSASVHLFYGSNAWRFYGFRIIETRRAEQYFQSNEQHGRTGTMYDNATWRCFGHTSVDNRVCGYNRFDFGLLCCLGRQKRTSTWLGGSEIWFRHIYACLFGWTVYWCKVEFPKDQNAQICATKS